MVFSKETDRSIIRVRKISWLTIVDDLLQIFNFISLPKNYSQMKRYFDTCTWRVRLNSIIETNFSEIRCVISLNLTSNIILRIPTQNYLFIKSNNSTYVYMYFPRNAIRFNQRHIFLERPLARTHSSIETLFRFRKRVTLRSLGSESLGRVHATGWSLNWEPILARFCGAAASNINIRDSYSPLEGPPM